MRLVLDGISAFEFWMNAVERPALGIIEPSGLRLTEFDRTTCKELFHTFKNNGGVMEPLHLLCQRPEYRRFSSCVQCGCLGQSTKLPPHSIYYLGGDIYVISPELTVLRLATQLPRLEFLRALTDMLSIYAVSAIDRQSLITRRPILTKSDLEQYLTAVGQMRGSKLTRKALGWVPERSASPRETSMNLLLALPTRLGGQAMPPFDANYEYKLTQEARDITRRNHLVADVAWPEKHVTLEYNSSKHHDNDEQKGFDFDKIAAMIRMKELVIPISTTNFSVYDSFASIVTGVRELLGVKDRHAKKVDQQRRATHEELLKIEREWRNKPSLYDTARWRYLQARTTPLDA